jgi:hypothetical protein
MNENARVTRRSLELFAAFVVVLCTGLPAAHAAKEQFYPIKLHVNDSAIELLSASGDILRARFESDVIVSPNGHARGNMTFTFADGSVLEYRAIAGRVELDAAGEIRRVWVSLVTRPDGDQRGFAVASIVPETSEDCLIYDILGPDVHDGAATFEVPGNLIALK